VKGKKNAIRFEVGNDEGASRKAAECFVVYTGPKPKRPEVTILSPTSANVKNPDITVVFRVISAGPLKSLALQREGGLTQTFDVSRLPAGPVDLTVSVRLAARAKVDPLDLMTLPRGTGGYFEAKTGLSLLPGINTLRVVAVNDGGEHAHAVVVN